MRHSRKILGTLATTGLLLAISPQAAYALDAQEVAERVRSTFVTQGLTPSWSGVEGTPARMTLRNVTVSAVGQDESLPLGDIVITDATEDGEAIVAGTMSIPLFVHSADGVNVNIENMSVSGLRMTPEDSGDQLAGIAFYESGQVGSLVVAMEGTELVSMRDLTTSATRPEDGQPLTFSGRANSITIDLGAVDDQQTATVSQALGLETINGSFSFSGSWSPEDGRLAVEQYDMAVQDAGTLGFTFDISGYTPAFLKALRDVQAKMADATEEEQAMQGMAMLGLLPQLNLHGARLRFDDDSLTQKVLAFLGAQQGVQAGDIANQAKAVLPFAMAQLNNPQLTAEVSAAVNAFLDNPESLEISIEPENPIPFALVAAGAMTAPQALPQQLGLRVRANR